MTICADLSVKGDWQTELKSGSTVVSLQAQIGGNDDHEFHKNNVMSTVNSLEAMKDNYVDQHIRVSSSVVNSVADDKYTNSKKMQEALVVDSQIEGPILRPTLMYGWFDRKHLGWLARFMALSPVFQFLETEKL